MLIKPATCCGLLLLNAATTLAQTHPPKKRSRKPAAVQQQARTSMQEAEETFIQNSYEMLSHNCDETMRHGHAQPEPVDSTRVYTYVEQMPTLHGQSSFATITAAIRQHLVLPPATPEGRSFVQFVVSKDGVVRKPQIVKGLRADVDSAVVVATRQLPRFAPGKQNGRVVVVSFTLAIPIGQPPVVTSPALRTPE